MVIENRQLFVLLRAIAKGEKSVLMHNDYDTYIAFQCKGWKEYKDWHEVSIISRLQYELYGEYPLSPANQSDWDINISKALKLS